MPGPDEVDAWFAAYDNPHKDLMLDIRRFILGVDGRIEERIRWKTPTFTYEGNIASFNPRSKRHVSLMFHAGATIPGDHPRLHRSGDVAAHMTFTDPQDCAAQRDDLAAAVRAWIVMKDGAAASPTGKD